MSNYSLYSPDQQLCLHLELENGALSYSVTKNEVTVIEKSPIGAVLSGVDLTNGLSPVSEKTGEINDQYTLPDLRSQFVSIIVILWSLIWKKKDIR